MAKITIYQLFPRIFGNITNVNKPWGSIEENGCGKFNNINDNTILSLKDLGITHIWLTGIIRHSTTTDYSTNKLPADNPLIVKGRAGSPYAINDYFDVDPDLACNVQNRMKEFEELIERIHNHGLKVVIDFVPNHVARQYNSNPNYGKSYISSSKYILGAKENNSKGFDINNNFYYLENEAFVVPDEAFTFAEHFSSTIKEYLEFPAKATGNDCFTSKPSVNDWYETIKLNYGIDFINNTKHFDPIPGTWLCMNEILHFWASKGIDGFRCDMAEMVPHEYWKWQINEIKTIFPEILFIAEIYKRELYEIFLQEANFDFLYDKVGMYDNLRDVLERKRSVLAITKSWQNTDGLNDKMLRFMENHDEQRIASHFFVGDAYKALPACAISAFLHQGPFMIYNGQEFGEKAEGSEGYSGNDGRSSIFDYWSIDCLRRWNNNGNFNIEQLSEKEKNLRNKYSIILNEAINEPAISNGKFYDLMWINTHLVDINCYVFIRSFNSQNIIYAVNFNEFAIDVKININKHVFEFIDSDLKDDITIETNIEGYWWKKFLM
ncbi:alpha-amylase family protein [Bacteroidales bacterium OttesenSCG-928-K22]|nr:alpha-amylase family protein [Bacteroidales bacterium OttesenSCG-928-L14]MDL2240412.1 alpha-amylase family protein [Bacteroidales bacterium OttesenSCG-928-K22]